MSTSRNTTTLMAAIKLGVFTATSIVVTCVLALIMGSFGFGAQKSYEAIFKSASMLTEGDDVRIAGVSSGKVTKIEIFNRKYAKVSFRLAASVPLTTTSRASIRYLNLIGERYLALTPGEAGGADLAENATIPMSQTEPALNLTALFAGFQPLFQALDPDQVNKLSMNIIKVLQGEGGNIATLMRNSGELSNTLADQNQLIGDVINNLSSMLQTVDDHRDQLNTLLLELEEWMGNLAKDRTTIGASLKNISNLTASLADLLQRGRPDLAIDIKQARRLATELTKPRSKDILDEVLERLPRALARQTRVGIYGSWYNYYLCDLTLQITLPDLGEIGQILNLIPGIKEIREGIRNIHLKSKAARCQ